MSAKLRKALQRSEHDEQVAVIQWIDALAGDHLARLIFAVPNGARTSISVAKRLKAEGLRKGVPDLMLPVARHGYHGLFIEMKRVGGVKSDTSIAQMGWHGALLEEGYRVTTCYGFEEARQTITAYLTPKP